MKKIVRLTERDLTRIVKRVINERDAWNWAKDTGSAVYDTVASDLKAADKAYLGGYFTGGDVSKNPAYQAIYKAMEGFGTDEAGVQRGCSKLLDSFPPLHGPLVDAIRMPRRAAKSSCTTA